MEYVHLTLTRLVYLTEYIFSQTVHFLKGMFWFPILQNLNLKEIDCDQEEPQSHITLA